MSTRPAHFRVSKPCPDKWCEHPECQRARDVATSPCTLCRAVCGYDVWLRDERQSTQVESGVWFTGFTHERCRIHFDRKQRKTTHNFRVSRARRLPQNPSRHMRVRQREVATSFLKVAAQLDIDIYDPLFNHDTADVEDNSNVVEVITPTTE